MNTSAARHRSEEVVVPDHEADRGTLVLEDTSEMTHVTSYAEVDEIFKSRAFRQSPQRTAWPLVGDTLTTLDGDAHFEQRRVESALFRRENLASLESQVLVPALRAELARLAAALPPGGVPRTDLPQLIRTALVYVSAQVIGLDGVDHAACDRLRAIGAKLQAGVTVQWAKSGHERITLEALEAAAAYRAEFISPARERRATLVADYRAGRLPASELPNDLITLCLLHPVDGSDSEGMAEREAMSYLSASVTTTAHGVGHAVKELAAWLERHPEDRPRTADPAFLRRVGSEVLRLYPTAPASIRRAAADTALSCTGRRFAAGEVVYLDRGAANRDTGVFGPDAAEFSPHRGLDRWIKPFGMAFGGGPHVCIGRQLAIGSYTEKADDAGADEAPYGTMVLVLRELYAAGIELDPEFPPHMNENTIARVFVSFPVRFMRLAERLAELAAAQRIA